MSKDEYGAESDREPARLSIHSDGQWFNTTVTLRDADGRDMVVPVEGFSLSATVGEPMRLTISTLNGPQIDLECPVVEHSTPTDQ